jgi:hypothetical protein
VDAWRISARALLGFGGGAGVAASLYGNALTASMIAVREIRATLELFAVIIALYIATLEVAKYRCLING